MASCIFWSSGFCTDYMFFDLGWAGRMTYGYVGLLYWISPLCFLFFYLEDSPSLFHQLDGSSRHDRIRSSVTLLVITSLLTSTVAMAQTYIYIYIYIRIYIHTLLIEEYLIVTVTLK